jgi:hypothetical protein
VRPLLLLLLLLLLPAAFATAAVAASCCRPLLLVVLRHFLFCCPNHFPSFFSRFISPRHVFFLKLLREELAHFLGVRRGGVVGTALAPVTHVQPHVGFFVDYLAKVLGGSGGGG